MTGNGDLKPTPAAEWLSASRKTVTCPSGRVCVIRQIFLEDYFPLDLLASGLDYEDGRVPPDVQKQYLKEHSQEIIRMFERTLCAGMLDPSVSAEPKPGQLGPRDLGRDAQFLHREIFAFSGFATEAIQAVDRFRDEQRERPDAGGGGEVLRETPPSVASA